MIPQPLCAAEQRATTSVCVWLVQVGCSWPVNIARRARGSQANPIVVWRLNRKTMRKLVCALLCRAQPTNEEPIEMSCSDGRRTTDKESCGPKAVLVADCWPTLRSQWIVGSSTERNCRQSINCLSLSLSLAHLNCVTMQWGRED